MKPKKTRMRSSRLAPVLQSALIAAVTYIALAALLMLGITPEQHDIRVGLPASMDILATKDVKDTVTTDQNREAAAAQVEPSYKSADSSLTAQVLSSLNDRFSDLTGALEGMTSGEVLNMSDDDFDAMNERLDLSLTRDQYVALLDTDPELVAQLANDSARLVRELMNNTLLEGQENTAVASMSRNLAASGYTPPLVSVASEIMRLCVRPNMLIDEEATEQNREKAREAVDTVIRVKGEVIVRRGEIVTNAQYQMLSSLGLLKEDSLDIPLMAGIALILLLIFASLGLYLAHCRRELLLPKPLTLLCLIFVLVVALSLAVGNWSAYLMPVSLGMLLISLLIDPRIALWFNVALGMTTSLLAGASNGLFTVAMFSVVMMSLASGPVVLVIFTRRQQRTTTLLAGMAVGVSNFLVTLAVGLINSAELSTVLTNALWAMASGIVCGVMCIGFQPVLEWMFNLATNPRLIELSNPNQPILRRLLMEAPGTYHHSIIVANLAEAAADAVGGNGLLARVGAYYHDIGKLKRPIYFKENQMGDNPHDRTDPRVSAAILTAHPRDGAAMGQKARLPEPVLDIIRQHHGDGVVLWFYDKAVKLYGQDQVDISAFRYDGPRPHSKEAAVVMLADSIEAAVRSIPEPNPEKVDALIRKLVRVKLDDGQLDESDLTFGDLETICSAFSTVLTGVFHERIEYPDVTIPPRKELPHEESQPAENPVAAETKPAPAEKPSVTETKAVSAEKPVMSETKPAPAEKPSVTEAKAAPVEKPAASETRPASAEKPVSSDAKAVVSVTKPAAPAEKPAAAHVVKPAATAEKPVAPAAKPAASTEKPAAPATKPASAKPAAPATKPAAPAAKPAPAVAAVPEPKEAQADEH